MPQPPHDSFFLVIEGLDGSGKTQISRRLHRTLSQTYRADVELTFEPHDPSTAGLYIRRVLTRKIKHVHPRTLALAFALNRADHVERIINPFLNSRPQRIIICDRYYLSSLVYQTTSEIDMEEIMYLNRGARQPDLTIFLNASTRVCYERMRNRPADRELFEKNLDQTRDKYLKAIDFLRSRGETIHEVNADDDMETVLNRILDTLSAHGPEWLVIQRPLIEEGPLDTFSLDDLSQPDEKIKAFVRRFEDRWTDDASPTEVKQALSSLRQKVEAEVEWLSYDDLGTLAVAYLRRWSYEVGDRLPWTETCAFQLEYAMPLEIRQAGVLLMLTEAQRYDVITKHLQQLLDQVPDAVHLRRMSDFMFVLDAAPAKLVRAYYEQDADGSPISPAIRIIGRSDLARLLFVDTLAYRSGDLAPASRQVIEDLLAEEQLQPYWQNAVTHLAQQKHSSETT